MQNLVFIVGFPRSGTTFLATKLGQLDNCAATPETRYFAEAVEERCVLSKRIDRKALKTELKGMQRIIDLGLNLDVALAGPDEERIDRREAFIDIMAAFAAVHGASTVIEKSPAHTYHIPNLLRWYPKAKIIAIIRDGRDAFLSLRNTPWGDWSAARYGADWVYRNQLISRMASQHPDRVKLVRFEDLVSDPEAVVESLALDLGLSGGSGRGASVTIPSWEKEWKTKAADAADASRIAVWKRQPETDELRAFIAVAGDELRRLGYDSPPSTAKGRLMLHMYPLERRLKQALLKGFVLIGQADRVSSQKGLERRLAKKTSRP